MTEKDSTAQTSDVEQLPAESVADGSAQDSVKRGGQIIGLVILLTLGWYLLADRFTPYTSQARVQGYVVGVAPKVAGLVTEVWVGNNEEVQQGQPLFQIDPSQYQIALYKALADQESAVRQVDAGGASVDSARANLLSAQANADKAEKNASRLQRLKEADDGTISVRQLEVAEANLQAAQAQVVSAKAAIEAAIQQMGGDDAANNNILKTAMAAVNKAELDLANTIVGAASRGIITDLTADVGNYAGTGTPVMTLVAIHDLWINAQFTENNLGHLEPGTPVDIVFDALPGQVIRGEIRSIGLGVSDGQKTQPGTLPTVQNNRDWLRQAQRFPVIVEFSLENAELVPQLRVGGQASVMAYSEGHGFLKLLGQFYMWLMSYLSYAY